MAFVRKLGIKGNADVARMMRVFLDVDVEGKHVIELDTFFDFFDVESSEYNKRAFRILTTFRGKVTIIIVVLHGLFCRPPMRACISSGVRGRDFGAHESIHESHSRRKCCEYSIGCLF